VLGLLRQAVDTMDQAVVMVTHDPTAAGYADRVLFLADGRLVDSMDTPTADRVLDRMKAFDAPAATGRPAGTGSTAARAATARAATPDTARSAAAGPRESDRR
jgi:putative ABC transport system ATP-binding protein